MSVSKKLSVVMRRIDSRLSEYKGLVTKTKDDIGKLNILRGENLSQVETLEAENNIIDSEITRSVQFIEAVSTAFGIKEGDNG